MKSLLLLSLSGLVLLSACSSTPKSPTVFDKAEYGKAVSYEEGVVLNVQDGKIEGEGSMGAAVVGAGLGAAAMGGVGQGGGNAAAMVMGAVVGGIAGAAVETFAKTEDAQRITVQLDSGKKIMVIQPTDKRLVKGARIQFAKTAEGDRVFPIE